jgi:hypothetical protein
MKALSLKQPWAEFVADGKKTIELRKWNTKLRGEFLIHASKIPDMDAMRRFGFPENSLPLGVILGKANLVDVKKYKNEEEFAKDASLHLATSEWGEYGFILDNISKLDKPIPALGKLNFWDFELKI